MPSVLNVAVVGPGLVGSTLLAQLSKQATPAAIKVIGVINSKLMITTPAGIELSRWPQELADQGVAANLDRFIDVLVATRDSSRESCVVVDCTSSQDVADRYPDWLSRGLHLATPNKKGFSGSLELYKAIKERSRPTSGSAAPLVYHEATVGAGLPILSTLNAMVRTGDEIEKIEGIFSGTLSFIFNSFSTTGTSASAPKFSEIVLAAKEKGYTEPDPRDDLNGLDVARKVIILGRLAGLSLDLSTLSVENIVPEALRTVATASEFLSALPNYDAEFAALNAKAQARGEVLRYVGCVDVKHPSKSGVRLQAYPASHPFAALKGSDNVVAYTTKRFPNPLIVQGAGAGADVTAFGIYSDLLQILDQTCD
ncbi:homoserine dehydrogenase-domain-containing protein [Cladochytrium replicatum]|nr:homoserine dehydrogenase-domain-containing protein [Cladochytrium replicatum]